MGFPECLGCKVAVNIKHFIFVLMASEFRNIANILVMSPKLDKLNEIMKIKVLLVEI